MSAAKKCPKCGTTMIVNGGWKGEVKVVAKSLPTMRIKTTYVCHKCGYLEKGQTIIQK